MKTKNEKFKRHTPLIGTILSLPSPEIAEILTGAGFDWLFIDAEHSSMGFGDVQRILQLPHENCLFIVRIPLMDEIWIKKALDMGADGIIVPMINTPEEAEKVVRWCTYPPIGTRSVGIARAQAYGMNFNRYIESANDETIIILQAEHIEAVKNIEKIVQVKGIDGIFVGPYDLSGSMNKLGDVADQEVQKKIEAVRMVCIKSDIQLGIFGIDAAAVKPYISKGFTLIAMGTDTMFLGNHAKEMLKEVRKF